MIRGVAWLMLHQSAAAGVPLPEGSGRGIGKESWVFAVLGNRLHLRRPGGRWASGSYLDGAAADAEALRLTSVAERDGFVLVGVPTGFSVRLGATDEAVRVRVLVVLGARMPVRR